MAQDGEQMGRGCMAFFGLCTVAAALQLVPGAHWLELDEAGFTECSMFKTNRCAWTDIREFGVIGIRQNKLVAFNYTPGFGRSKIGRGVARAISGETLSL